MTIPISRSLIVTTASNIYALSNNGAAAIFSSETSGIVAAKKSNDTLAIADGQVVVLRDIKRGMERSHKLKSGPPHMIQYFDKSLFYIAALQNAVQTNGTTLSVHPSTPICFAVSSNLLLSASPSPPTIHLQNRILQTPPISMLPSASSTPVSLTNFHPDRASTFLLA